MSLQSAGTLQTLTLDPGGVFRERADVISYLDASRTPDTEQVLSHLSIIGSPASNRETEESFFQTSNTRLIILIPYLELNSAWFSLGLCLKHKNVTFGFKMKSREW